MCVKLSLIPCSLSSHPFPLVVESFFDTDEGYNFKLAESRTIIQELQEQLSHLTQDGNNSEF